MTTSSRGIDEVCLFARSARSACAVIVTCHVPPDPEPHCPHNIRRPYRCLDDCLHRGHPIAGMLPWKKVTLTCAPMIGFPAVSVN